MTFFETTRDARPVVLSSEEGVRRVIGELVSLSQSDEACALLGVSGSLATQVDLEFVRNPTEWIAGDIANSILTAESDEDDPDLGGVPLAVLVAEIRLQRTTKGEIDELQLREAVMRALSDSK